MVVCRRGCDRVRARRDHPCQRALGRTAPVERGNDRREPPSPVRRVHGGQPRNGDPDGRIGGRARHRAAVFLRAAVYRGAHRYARRVPRDESRRGAWLSRRRDQREQHGGSRIRRRSADAVRPTGRARDALPRILQRGTRRHVGAGQGRRSPGVRPQLTPDNGERPVYGSNCLVLAHFWAAFAAFALAIPLGAWQMLVRSPAASLGRPGAVLPRGHGAWHHARLRLSRR